jgi:hypothetical protein
VKAVVGQPVKKKLFDYLMARRARVAVGVLGDVKIYFISIQVSFVGWGADKNNNSKDKNFFNFYFLKFFIKKILKNFSE